MARRRPLHLVEVGVRWPPETFLRRKLEGLAARGVRVTVAPNLMVDDRVRLRGVELLRPPLPGSGRFGPWRAGLAVLARSPRRLVRLVRNIDRVPPELRRRHGGRRGLLVMCLPLARLRPDVVQFEWNTAAVDHLPLFDVWGCPVVTSCRGSDVTVYPYVPNLGPYAARLPEVMRQASAVHCVSESLKREAAGFGLDPAKAHVIRPAVDPEVFRPGTDGRDDHDGLRVLTVGGLRWEKGYEYALQAIRALVDRGVPVTLEVIGEIPNARVAWSSEGERIRHTIDDLGLADHVHLRGAAGAREVSRRLAAANVLLHASLAEGIPNVVLEAMACAVPVVTTDCGGVCEVLTDGVEGFVVAPRDPGALAEALVRLWRDSALRDRMGAAGRARIRSGFTLERQLGEFLAMYREVAA